MAILAAQVLALRIPFVLGVVWGLDEGPGERAVAAVEGRGGLGVLWRTFYGSLCGTHGVLAPGEAPGFLLLFAILTSLVCLWLLRAGEDDPAAIAAVDRAFFWTCFAILAATALLLAGAVWTLERPSLDEQEASFERLRRTPALWEGRRTDYLEFRVRTGRGIPQGVLDELPPREREDLPYLIEIWRELPPIGG